MDSNADLRAARYELLLEMAPEDDPRRRELELKLADALAENSQEARAAQVLFEAARRVPEATQARALLRQAAEQLLRSGHVDAGMEAFREVLAQTGVSLRKTQRGAVASFLLGRALLKLRGMRFEPRPENEVAPAELERLDTCYSAALGLCAIDPIQSVELQTRMLRLALKIGEPRRVARALAMEVATISAGGSKAAPRAAALLARVQELIDEVRDPLALALLSTAGGMAAANFGQWAQARARCERALTILREHCRAAAWETATCQYYQLWALLQLGEMREHGRLVAGWLAGATARDDLYAATSLRWHQMFAHLAADDADAARAVAGLAQSEWSQRGFQVAHAWSMYGRAFLELYAGHPARAWESMCELWPAYSRSLFPRVQPTHVIALSLRGGCATAAAAVEPDRARRRGLVRIAERAAREISRARMPWSDPHADVIAAGAAAVAGRRACALAGYQLAVDGYRRADMALYAAAARRRWGELRADAAGELAVRDADDAMRAAGVVNPSRFTAALAPGY